MGFWVIIVTKLGLSNAGRYLETQSKVGSYLSLRHKVS